MTLIQRRNGPLRLLIGVLLVLWPSLAGVIAEAGEITWPQRLHLANAAYRDNDFKRGVALVENVLHEGNLSPTERAAAFLLRGLCQTNLGNHDAAVQDFELALELDPSLRVEGKEFLSSEVQNFSTSLRRYTEKHPLEAPSPPGPPWKFIMPGTVVLGGLVYLIVTSISSSDEEASPLPDIPNPPGN